jgi:hypothetical protein
MMLARLSVEFRQRRFLPYRRMGSGMSLHDIARRPAKLSCHAHQARGVAETKRHADLALSPT